MKEIAEKSLFEIPQQLKTLLWVFVALGIGMFVVGLTGGDKESLTRAWETLLINVVFWAGISQAGVIFAVIWQITDAKWARPFKRLAEACGAFLPVAFCLFIVVFFGVKVLYEWSYNPFLHNGHAVKAGWLNIQFFIVRNIFWLLLIYGLSYIFVRISLKPDFALARRFLGDSWGGTFADRLLRGYGNHEEEVIRLEQISRRLAPVMAMIYAIGGSFLAWDFVMSLDQEWFSTLFGVFFLVGNMHAFLGLMLAIAVTVRKKFGIEEYITINRLHDLAKLTFAFSLLWTYMGFSQYIVIWYANMAEETPFLIIRSMTEPWSKLFLLVLVWLFFSVFFLLLPRTLCRIPNYIRAVGIYVFTGHWLAIYLMVVPSLQEFGNYHFYMGAYELLITLGFVGAFFLCYLSFLGKVPILPISDKHLCRTWHGH